MGANESKGVLAVIDRARDVLAEIYAKHQRAIGPFASQAQKSNGQLREARAAVAELIRDMGVLQARLDMDGRMHGAVSKTDAARIIRAALARVGGGE